MSEIGVDVPFDHYSEAFATDPYPQLADLRSSCPVAHSSEHGGFWIVTRHAEIHDLCSRPAVFSSRYSSIPKDIGLGDVQIPPLQLDPPSHTRLRRILTPVFSVAQAAEYEATTRVYAAQLLDELVPAGRFDASNDYARLIPSAVLCQLLGVPNELEFLSQIVDRILDSAATDPAAAIEAGMQLFELVGAAVADRAGEQRGDLLSRLLAAEVEGHRLNIEEVTLVGILMVLAGIDTTWSTLSLAIHHLATHPEDQRRLRDDETLLEPAREEFLRLYAPVTVARQLTIDAVLAGVQLRRGDMVLVSLPSANRDEAVFDRAEEFDPERMTSRHLAFGSGIHRCLGRHIARMELSVGLGEFLRRVPPFHLEPDEDIVWARGQVRRAKRLPVAFEVPR